MDELADEIERLSEPDWDPMERATRAEAIWRVHGHEAVEEAAAHLRRALPSDVEIEPPADVLMPLGHPALARKTARDLWAALDGENLNQFEDLGGAPVYLLAWWTLASRF